MVERFQLYPAIDLRGGQCVRLRQGDYTQETVFDSDPGAVGRRFVAQGATYLHIVDLDGAKAGRPINGEAIRSITACGVPCQLGGGLRTLSDVEAAFSWGASRVIIGTKAVHSPSWLADLARQFPRRVVLGIDARDGLVATEGWLDTSQLRALDLARQCDEFGLAAFVCTDIARDGMLQGPNFTALSELAAAVRTPVIASGGVTTVEHIARLAELPLQGAIIGRALYEGRLSLSDALSAAERPRIR